MLRIALCDDGERDRAEINALLDQYLASRAAAARVVCYVRKTGAVDSAALRTAWSDYWMGGNRE